MPKTTPLQLTTFRAATAPQPTGEGAAKALPTRFLILPWGTHDTNKGRVVCNERTVRELATNQARIKRPTIKVDFEHESCRPDVKQPIKFAAEGKPEIVPGEGVYLTAVRWTAEGTAQVPEHHGDLSPACYRDPATGEVIGLHSVAACAHGELDGVTLNPATFSADLALLSTHTQPASPATTMDDTALLTQLLTALGVELAADATPEARAAAVASAVAGKPAAAGVTPLSAADLAQLQTQLTTLSAEIASLKAADTTNDIQRQIDQASALGKLVQLSAEDLTTLGPVRAKAYLDALKPGVVPMDQRTPVQLSAGQSLTPGMDEDHAAALRDLGHDPATFKA